ncbi:hypothetical protein ABK040_009419 [Willaertia magna]
MINLEELNRARKTFIHGEKVTEICGPELPATSTLEGDNVKKINVGCFVYKKDPSDRQWKHLIHSLVQTPHPSSHPILNSNSNFIQFNCVQLDPSDIRNNQLIIKKINVLWIGGGLAPEHCERLMEKGKLEILKFLQFGGGYIGCCAGAYIACTPFDLDLTSWNYSLLNYSILDLNNWERGMGMCNCELTSDGMSICNPSDVATTDKEDIVMFYRNGPLFIKATKENLKTFGSDKSTNNKVLVTFKQTFKKKEGVDMIDTPAVICGEYGKGRVIAYSTHPEASEEKAITQFKCSFVWCANICLIN